MRVDELNDETEAHMDEMTDRIRTLEAERDTAIAEVALLRSQLERALDVPMSGARSRLTHGGAGTPEYRSFMAMHDRCERPGASGYALYGGRGIKVCERWRTFENFRADMGPRPAGTSLDRIDSDGHYEPGNCRWATPKEQVNNRRAAFMVEIGGRRQSLSDWDREAGLARGTVGRRLRAGRRGADLLKPVDPDKHRRGAAGRAALRTLRAEPLPAAAPKREPPTHCKRGHPFSVYGRIRPTGERRCRECHRLDSRARSLGTTLSALSPSSVSGAAAGIDIVAQVRAGGFDCPTCPHPIRCLQEKVCTCRTACPHVAAAKEPGKDGAA